MPTTDLDKIAARTPVLRHVPVVGLAITAAGIGVGLVASGLADAAYEALPDSITQPFEEGVSAVGNAIGDGASAVADGAREVWDSIF